MNKEKSLDDIQLRQIYESGNQNDLTRFLDSHKRDNKDYEDLFKESSANPTKTHAIVKDYFKRKGIKKNSYLNDNKRVKRAKTYRDSKKNKRLAEKFEDIYRGLIENIALAANNQITQQTYIKRAKKYAKQIEEIEEKEDFPGTLTKKFPRVADIYSLIELIESISSQEEEFKF